MGGAFLAWALEAFSGYAAVDELYEGRYCVLSAVDNRQYKRVLYEVLDHDPCHGDIEAFLGRLKTALDARNLTLRGSRPMARPSIPIRSAQSSARCPISSAPSCYQGADQRDLESGGHRA